MNKEDYQNLIGLARILVSHSNSVFDDLDGMNINDPDEIFGVGIHIEILKRHIDTLHYAFKDAAQQ